MAKRKTSQKTSPKLQQAQLYKIVTIAQTKIIQKISKLKKSKVNDFRCLHLVKLQPSQNILYDPQINYYDKFWKQYLLLQSFIHKFKQFKQQIIDFQNSVIHIQERLQGRQMLLNSEILLRNKRPMKRPQKTKIQDSNQHIIQNQVKQMQQQSDKVQQNKIQYFSQEQQENVSIFIAEGNFLSPQIQQLKFNSYNDPSDL